MASRGSVTSSINVTEPTCHSNGMKTRSYPKASTSDTREETLRGPACSGQKFEFPSLFEDLGEKASSYSARKSN